MKNQYFGDVNDYLKYSLLRAIAGGPTTPLLICWMLTADDGKSDGSLTQYLTQPDRFRAVDPPLFDALLVALENGQRTVEIIERLDLIPGASYHSQVLTDSAESRTTYLEALWSLAPAHEAVFFDPDNGFAPASIPLGRRNSSKYLYWDEFAVAIEEGLSTIVYQHFPRVVRDDFLADVMARMRDIAPAHSISALYSPRVAYLIAASPGHEGGLDEAVEAVQAAWGDGLRHLRL